jgi:transcriptional regulator
MDRLSDQHALIEANDFAVLVASGADGLVATHVPMLLKRDEGKLGTLYAHFAKANPHSELLGREMLAIFSGPHAYVSPSWYLEREINVPTWNYSAVHCYGVVEPYQGQAITLLSEMAQVYEAGRVNGWSTDELHSTARDNMPKGVTALRMEITRIEGKAKHSQNKPRLERERVIKGLKDAGEVRLAAIMEQELDRF